MILMWLGSLILMLLGLEKAQQAVANSFKDMQKNFFEKGQQPQFGTLFFMTLASVLTEASPTKSLYTGIGFYNLRIAKLRSSVLMMCLSTVGSFWILLMAALFLNFNGYFLLGVGGVLFLSSQLTIKVKNILNFMLGVGLFLIGGESTLRNSSVLQTLLGQGDLVFFLSDGRFGAVFTLLAFALVAGLFIRFEFWSLILSLCLMVTGTISMNGVLGLLVGERISHLIVFLWRTRNLDQECQRLSRQFSRASFLGILVGFFMAGSLKVIFQYSPSYDLNSFQNKSIQVIMLLAALLAGQFFVQMLWGHFASQQKAEEMPQAKYFSESWTSEDLLSLGGRSWAKEKLAKRLSEIRYHLAGLESLKEGQIPETIRTRLREEEVLLSRVHL